MLSFHQYFFNRFRMKRDDGIYSKACDTLTVRALYSCIRDWVKGPIFLSDTDDSNRFVVATSSLLKKW